MSLTLMLDLDDTLLTNDIETFLPNYLDKFSNHLNEIIPRDIFIKALLKGTRAMVENQRPDRTLKNAFDEVFYSMIDLTAADFDPAAVFFYTNIYPQLQDIVTPRPEAVSLVEEAQQRGYRIAIATNPLFPRTAILQRLAWANLPAEQYAFEVITSYESFHFAKPHPAYFAETLARMGWPEGAVVVVGDDIERDIQPAMQLGLASFWVVNNESPKNTRAIQASKKGNLQEVLPWIDNTPYENLQPDTCNLESIFAILLSTPAALDGFCIDLEEDFWIEHPDEHEWCLTEILCHLRDVDHEVHFLRIQKIIQEENPFLPGEDTDLWAIERQYKQQDGQLALQNFTRQRMVLVEMLQSLPEEMWDKKARHAILGPTRLRELVEIIIRHDQLHIRQVYQLLKKLSTK